MKIIVKLECKETYLEGIEQTEEQETVYGVIEINKQIITVINKAEVTLLQLRDYCKRLIPGETKVIYGEIATAIDCQLLEDFKGVLLEREQIETDVKTLAIIENNNFAVGDFKELKLKELAYSKPNSDWTLRVSSEGSLEVEVFSGYNRYIQENLDLEAIRQTVKDS